MAGITDVPKVKNDSSEIKDKKIHEVAEIGTQNILDSINDECKIIFPSTHVVYEGIKMRLRLTLKRKNKLNQFYPISIKRYK